MCCSSVDGASFFARNVRCPRDGGCCKSDGLNHFHRRCDYCGCHWTERALEDAAPLGDDMVRAEIERAVRAAHPEQDETDALLAGFYRLIDGPKR